MTSRIDLTLYQHNESNLALLLSIDGHPSRAQWIPRSLIDEPNGLQIVKPHGEAVGKGTFKVESWKATELGWIDEDDERQGELL